MAQEYNSTSSVMTTGTNQSAEMTILELLDGAAVSMSRTEQTLISLYLTVISVVTYSLNALFLHTVIRQQEFHTPNMVGLVAHALYDLLFVSFYIVPSLYLVIYNQVSQSLRQLFCMFRLIYLTSFFCQHHNIICLSIERLLYFYKPMSYNLLVTVRRALLVEVVLFGAALIYVSITTMLGNSYLSPSSMSCQQSSISHYYIINSVLFYIPSFLAVVLSIILLLRLIMRHKNLIQAQDQQATQSVSLISNTKSALRMVTCISASNWLTYYPGLLVGLTVMSTTSSDDMELGVDDKNRLVIKMVYMILFAGTLANSLIYVLFDQRVRDKIRAFIYRQ